ncbi:hypothetical protein P7C70_g6109, partial [Phenoliferia sp. Uapishka_3]
MWINAIRLAGWERSRCNEIYTGTLLGMREPKGGWIPHDDSKGRLEGWIKARLPGDTEWRKVWVVLMRGGAGGAAAAAAAAAGKKTKRTSILSFGRRNSIIESPLVEDLPGDGNNPTLAFFADKPSGKKEKPLCIAQHRGFFFSSLRPCVCQLTSLPNYIVYYVSAVFPESEALINRSTLFKIEGSFLNPADTYKTAGWGVGGRAEKQGLALLMLDEGDSMVMLNWIVAFADAFKLYGRPRTFSFDPRDPSSLYFALPVGPHRDRQFLDRELVDNMRIDESRPRAVRAVFHNILFDRMRGVRPPALEAPPPPSNRESFEEDLIQQQQFQRSDPRNESGAEQRMSELPPIQMGGRSTSSMGLPPIGESTSDEHTIEAQLQQPPSTFQRRDVNESSPTIPTSRLSTPDYLGGALSPDVNERSGTATSDALDTYTAFISSDVAKDPEPAQYSTPQSFRTSRSSFSPNASSSGHQQPINISTSAPPPASNPTPNFSRPTNDEPGSPMSHKSGLTHLTYAAPNMNATKNSYERGFYAPPQSVVGYNPATGLPSPGAPSTATLTSISDSSGEGSRTSLGEVEGLAYLDRNHPGAVVQPGPPSFAAPSSRALTPPSYRNQSPPVAGPSGEPHSSKSASATPPPSSAVPTPSTEYSQSPSAVSPVSRSSEDPSSTGRLSELHQHQGGVTDSPESLNLASPSDTAYNTKPLFSPKTLSKELPPPVNNANDHVLADASSALAPDANAPAASASPRSQNARRPSPPLSIQTHQAPQTRQGYQSAPSEDHDSNIHSDLLAALDFVDRSESPPPPNTAPESPFSAGPSPVVSQFHVGPPTRRAFLDHPPSPVDKEYSDKPSDNMTAVASSGSAPTTTAFPSIFSKNKRAEERAAAAQEAQLAQRASVTQPGRARQVSKGKGKKGLWEDSDEEEEEPEEDDDDEEQVSRDDSNGRSSRDNGLPPRPTSQHNSQPSSSDSARNSRALPVPPTGGYQDQYLTARQSYYENGPSSDLRTSPVPPSPPYGDNNNRDASPGRPLHKPVVSPHGLLHAGILEKEERSARAMEYQARDTGGPLVNLPSKPPPPQTGLVGALTSHQREKERTGGVGRALTEQQRERKLAEQRQKQLDDLQKAQLQQQQQQMSMSQMGGYGGYNPMMGMGFNPMMYGGGMGMMGMPQMGYGMMPTSPGMGGSQIGMGGGSQFMGGGSGFMGAPASQMGGGSQFGGGGAQSQMGGGAQEGQMDAQVRVGVSLASQQQAQAQAQHAQMMQQQAMMAAQHAYMMAMSQFQPPAHSPDGTAPTTPAGMPGLPSFPSMGSMSFMQPPFSQGPGSSFGYNPYAQQQSVYQNGEGSHPDSGNGTGSSTPARPNGGADSN